MDESSDLLHHTVTSPFRITPTIRPSKHQSYKAIHDTIVENTLWRSDFKSKSLIQRKSFITSQHAKSQYLDSGLTTRKTFRVVKQFCSYSSTSRMVRHSNLINIHFIRFWTVETPQIWNTWFAHLKKS
eukprot:92760_1